MNRFGRWEITHLWKFLVIKHCSDTKGPCDPPIKLRCEAHNDRHDANCPTKSFIILASFFHRRVYALLFDPCCRIFSIMTLCGLFNKRERHPDSASWCWWWCGVYFRGVTGWGRGVVSYFLCVGRAHKSGPIITRCCRALQLAALSPVCWPIYPKASINGAVNSVAASLVPVRFGSVRDTSASIRSDTHKIILRTRGHHESGMRLELVTISRRTFAPTYETLRSLWCRQLKCYISNTEKPIQIILNILLFGSLRGNFMDEDMQVYVTHIYLTMYLNYFWTVASHNSFNVPIRGSIQNLTRFL